jgi:hypothetical protein
MGNPPCATKAARDGFAVLDAGRDVLQLGAEVGELLAPGQQLDGAEDGKAGADEGEELLVEDEKGLQLDLLGLAEKPPAGRAI